jgi:radical SAM protein (TIGR01212 family)
MLEASQRYRKLNTFLRRYFGQRVYRIGLIGDFTCPNRDGSKGTGGCLFCNPASSEPLGYLPGTPLAEQLVAGTRYVRWRHEANRYIAYFMDHTTTYGDPACLERDYREALACPGVVGLAVSTRPDCLSDEVLDLLQRMASETFVWIELGVQSAGDDTLARLNRCHTMEDTRRAISGLQERRIPVSAHVILGLPGESAADMLATARFLGEVGVQGAKVHNLHVVKDTPLAEMNHRGKYRPLELAEYVDLAVRFLENLPPDVIVQRVCGEAPRRLTVAPDWSVNKLAVVNAVEKELMKRDTWQGKALGATLDDLQVTISLPGVPPALKR